MEKERNLGNDFLNNLCINCNNPMQDEWQYCPNCKTKVETTKCVECGEEIRHNWNYCPYCKKEVACCNISEDKVEIADVIEPEDSNEWLRNMLVNK